MVEVKVSLAHLSLDEADGSEELAAKKLVLTLRPHMIIDGGHGMRDVRDRVVRLRRARPQAQLAAQKVVHKRAPIIR